MLCPPGETMVLWERTVRVVLKAALFARDYIFWDLPAFMVLDNTMDLSAWRVGGCETLGDLYPSDVFISFEVAQEAFSLGPGQFLQYISISTTAKEIWTTYPTAPTSSHMFRAILEYGGDNI